MNATMPDFPGKPLALLAACMLLAGCALGQAKVVVTPESDDSFLLEASKGAGYATVNYQTVFLQKSAQLAVDNGYRYFNVERSDITSQNRSQRSVSWQIRLHNDDALETTSLTTYRAAEVLDYGPRQQALRLKR